MKKRVLLIAIVLIPVVFISYSLLRRLIGSGDEEVVSEGTPVATASPQLGSLERTLVFSGTLMPKSQIAVFSKVPGKVEDVHVKEGEAVSKGTLLAEIEDEAVTLQMRQAEAAWQSAAAQLDKAKRGLRQGEVQNTRASVQQAEKDFDLARKNLSKYGRLYEAGTIAKAEYEEVKNKFEAAETSLENAKRSLQMVEEGASTEDLAMADANERAMKAQYDLAALQVEFTKVKAPVSGVVAQLLVDEGNLLGQATPILVIVQDDPIYVEIPVAEKYYGEVTENIGSLEARVYPDAFSDDRMFAGTVTSVSTMIDPKSRTFLIEVEIGNPSAVLRPGMYADVEIVLTRFEDALLVPISAVVIRNGRQIVFAVVEEDSYHVRSREVEVGISNENDVQILSGLSETDEIVYQGNSFLEDGQKVKIVEQK